MDAVTHLAPTIGIVAACDFLAVPRASFYRQRPVLGPPASPAPEPALPVERAAPARSLREAERDAVRQVLHEERFQDRSPAAVQATLLDEGQYLCSTRTMYRILEQEGESGERRDQLVHPAYHKPELLATAPNQLWSWDITKLRGPVKRSTAAPASLYSPLPWFISARPRPSWINAKWCSMPPTERTPTASYGNHQNHCPCPRRFGSTSRFHPAKRQRKKVTKLPC